MTLQGWPTQAGTHSNRGGGPFKPRWLICKQAIQVPGQGVWEELLSTFPSPILAISCNNKLYFFYCLTFGLATALKVFASMMKLPISRLRFKSFNVLNYLDKLIIWGRTKVLTVTASKPVQQELLDLGFLMIPEIPNSAQGSFSPLDASPGFSDSWKGQSFCSPTYWLRAL